MFVLDGSRELKPAAFFEELVFRVCKVLKPSLCVERTICVLENSDKLHFINHLSDVLLDVKTCHYYECERPAAMQSVASILVYSV